MHATEKVNGKYFPYSLFISLEKTITKIMNQTYECAYHYTERSIGNMIGVNGLQSWIYPNLEKIIFELQQKWDENNVPLKIEIQDKRIKLTHKTPEKRGNYLS